MYKKELEQELRDYFKIKVKKIEPTDEWWTNTVYNISQQKHRPSWFGLLPKTRLAWVLLPLIILLFGGVVYGTISGVQKLFNSLAKDVEIAGLAQTVNVSQTIDGVTITLEKVYADSNVVLIGYTVEKANETKIFYGGKLFTSDGLQLFPLGGMSNAIDSAKLGVRDDAMIWIYDASTLIGTPSELNLKLEISPTFLPDPNTPTQASVNPFTFNFTVPFHAGKEIEINQTVEKAGVSIILEKVVISPWATRAELKFHPPDGADPSPTLSLMLPNGTYKDFNIGKYLETGSANYCIGDFTHQHGEWTLNAKELVFFPDSNGQNNVEVHPASDTKRLAGPWIFHFNVP